MSEQQAGRDVGRGARGEGRCEELGAMGSGRRAGLRARVCSHLPHHLGEGVHARAGGETTGANPGDTRRLPWGVLARGITDGFVIGQYRHAAQHSAVTPKGIWELSESIHQGMDRVCPWTQLFIAHEYRTRTESSGGEGLGRPLPGAGQRRALPASPASTVGRGETPWLRRRCGTPCSTGTERVSAAKSSPAGARVSADRG